MLYLSKSKYVVLWQCPKMLWLSKYKPEEAAPVDESTQARFDAGNEVGDLAMGLFGDFVEVTTLKEDGGLDLGKMIERTDEEIAKGTANICEAAFSYNGLYCAVDILRREGDGWAIYEVKSSSSSRETEKVPQYIVDIAYQKYVLEHCGINVTGTYLVRLNSEYYLDGALDVQSLFAIDDVSIEVADEISNVEPNLKLAEEIMSKRTEPNIEIGIQCASPYECRFMEYCHRDLPSPSVFNLYKMNRKTALGFYERGMTDFRSVYDSGEINGEQITGKIQLMQMEQEINGDEPHIDREGIKEFLETLHYPLYFLDFETMQPVIPTMQGTKPYQQIPFQYSLHFIEQEGGTLQHKEFLAESGADPRRDIAEALCKDIPTDACVLAYKAGFEKGRIKELAGTFSDLAERLLTIEANIKDLLVPFQQGCYYNRAMGGSFSIKSVLPAVFPDDPELDYHNLELVHNGGEAMNIFPKIQFMASDEAERTRTALLKYCELDTLAMVKLWQELVRVAS